MRLAGKDAQTPQNVRLLQWSTQPLRPRRMANGAEEGRGRRQAA